MRRLRYSWFRLGCTLAWGVAGAILAAQPTAEAAPPPDIQAAPWVDGEVLVYEITWPSGLSLGEARFRAKATQNGWSFEHDISASLPTMEILDEYRAKADTNLCSTVLDKKVKHGKTKYEESITYDQSAHRAERRTLGGGGESEVAIPPCVRDGLTYLYYLRR